jgi:hypothetical protein
MSISRLLLVSVAIISIASLSGCKYNRVKTAQAAKTELIGMSKGELLSCAGVPDKTMSSNGVEFLSYRSGGETSFSANTFYGYNTTTLINSSYKFCDITIALKNDKVQKVSYSGKTGGLLTQGEQCAYVLENCVGGNINSNKPYLLKKQSSERIGESSIEITNPSYVDNPNFVPFTVKFNNPTDTDKVISITNGRIAYILRPEKGVKISSFSGRVRAFSLQSKINIKVEAYDSASKTAGQVLDEKTSYYKSKTKALVPAVVDDNVKFTQKFTSNKLKVSFDNKLGRDGVVLFNLDTPKGRIQLIVTDGASGSNGEKYLHNGIERELSGYFSIEGNFNQANVSKVEIKKKP